MNFPDPNSESTDSSTVIDCGTCIGRETSACVDCVVTFLFREDSQTAAVGQSIEPGATATAIIFDISEIRAMRALAEAGLVPTLRHRESG